MKQTHNSSFTKLQNRIIIDILTYIEDWKTRVEFMKSTKRISYMQWPSWWNLHSKNFCFTKIICPTRSHFGKDIPGFLRTMFKSALVKLQVTEEEFEMFESAAESISNYQITIFCEKKEPSNTNTISSPTIVVSSNQDDDDNLDTFDLDNYDNQLLLTPSGSHSFLEAYKQPISDLYDTPERTYDATKRFKAMHKAEDIK
ncbi:hypothetical protein BDC45DRAFT_581669 [Circinella umbellata]|nr:hypothetical protein BDC45DRAFT_581669 [Circinella umbellata]